MPRTRARQRRRRRGTAPPLLIVPHVLAKHDEREVIQGLLDRRPRHGLRDQRLASGTYAEPDVLDESLVAEGAHGQGDGDGVVVVLF